MVQKYYFMFVKPLYLAFFHKFSERNVNKLCMRVKKQPMSKEKC